MAARVPYFDCERTEWFVIVLQVEPRLTLIEFLNSVDSALLKEKENMLKWFNADLAKSFGNQLADFLIEKMPQDDVTKKEKALKKRGEVIASLLWKIDEFKKSHKLNLYQKAQFGNTLKWRLLEAGFEREFVNEVTHLVLTSV